MSKTQSKLGVTIKKSCDCACWAHIKYYLLDDGSLKLFSEGCTSGVITWQFFNTLTLLWEDVQTGGSSHIWADPGYYRVKIVKTDCCDVYSNVEETYNL